MKVLWFVQANFDPSNEKKGYNGAGWISSLLGQIKKQDGVEVYVAYHGKVEQVYKKDNVSYISMKSPKIPLVKKIISRIKDDFIEEEKSLWKEYFDIYKKTIQFCNPNIIQIFGTENTFGLICGQTDIPVIVHIQGIVNPYFNAYLPPAISKHDKFALWKKVNSWRKLVFREKEICKHVKYYIGRTEWDKRVSAVMSPSAKYFYGSEILRSCFYGNDKKKVIPEKLTIVSTISIPIYKGYDLILKSAQLLTEMGVSFTWKVIGNVTPGFIEKTIGIFHKNVNVELLGVKSDIDLKEELLSCTLYVHPSYIDNSPNSVCEAQILGCTCIATNVGGISSLIKDGVSGYLVPANDPYQTAYLINELYCNPEKNVEIGNTAQKIALERHCKERICKALLETYETIIEEN